MHPTQIENPVDLPDQMVGRHDLVEIKRIKELTLSAFPTPHHLQNSAMIDPSSRNHGSPKETIGLLQHNQLSIGQKFRGSFTTRIL
jgi:hypothetical protein